MTATTHYAFSYLLCAAAGVEPATAAAASLLSLLPDIDHPESTIGRVFRPVSKKIQQKYGHRTITHSLFAILVLSAALLPLLLLPRLLVECCRASCCSTSSKRRRTFVNSWNRAVASIAGSTSAPCSNRRTNSGQGSLPVAFGATREADWESSTRRTRGAMSSLAFGGTSMRMVGRAALEVRAGVVSVWSPGCDGMAIRFWHDGQLICTPAQTAATKIC